MLAMHMANELLNAPVALALNVIAAGFVLFASARTRVQFDPQRVPLMGVMGAFVFAAEMINFPILGVASGHLGGGVLLAILLGPHAATLVMASILIIQCLIFQDGGVLALGANIINMGVVPCYLGHALFRILTGQTPSARRLYVSVFVATVVGMVCGAMLVPLQSTMSGMNPLSLKMFLTMMVSLHLMVALGEAIITFMVIGYLGNVRPELLGPLANRLTAARGGISRQAAMGSLVVIALLLGGVVSWYASSAPDALESITAVESDSPVAVDPAVERANAFQEKTAPLADYQASGLSESAGTSLSGIGGALLTMLVVWFIGRSLRQKTSSQASPPTGASRA